MIFFVFLRTLLIVERTKNLVVVGKGVVDFQIQLRSWCCHALRRYRHVVGIELLPLYWDFCGTFKGNWGLHSKGERTEMVTILVGPLSNKRCPGDVDGDDGILSMRSQDHKCNANASGDWRWLFCNSYRWSELLEMSPTHTQTSTKSEEVFSLGKSRHDWKIRSSHLEPFQRKKKGEERKTMLRQQIDAVVTNWMDRRRSKDRDGIILVVRYHSLYPVLFWASARMDCKG